jgi:hypothetical protein
MEFPILPWIAVVGVGGFIARLRGASVREVVAGLMLAFVLSVLAWGTVWFIGPVASVAAVAFLVAWIALLWVVRRSKRQRFD